MKEQFEATDPVESGSCYEHLEHYANYKLTTAREIEDLSNEQEIWKEPEVAFRISTPPKGIELEFGRGILPMPNHT